MANKKALWIGCGSFCCALIITGIVLFAVSFRSLEATEFGLKYNTYTKQVDKSQIYEQGTYFVGPSVRFIKFPLQVQAITFNNLTVRTLDGMRLNLGVSLQYKLSKQLEVTLKLLFDWGEGLYENIIDKRAKDSIRDSSAKFAVDSYVYSRQEIDTKMQQELSSNLIELGVTLQNFQLTEVDFPDSFSSVIVSTQQLQINVTNAQNDRLRALQEAQGRLAKADTDAQNYFLTQQSSIISQMAKYDAQSSIYSSFMPNYIQQLLAKEPIFGDGLWYNEYNSYVNQLMNSGIKLTDIVPTPLDFKTIFATT